MSFSASYWTFAQMGPYLVAVPYTQNAAATGPYLWSNQGASNAFSVPSGAPGYRVAAVGAQFLMLGDLYQQQQQLLMTGDGSTTTYSGAVSPPILSTGTIFDQEQHLTGTFANGVVTGTGYLASGTINNTTGSLALTFGTAPPAGDKVFASYTQVAPYRVGWSGIGDPTNWPTPLTNAALAAESSYQDLSPQYGPVMNIAGYPLAFIIAQRIGLTLATYIGGEDVFSFQQYDFTHGVVAHGACVQVGGGLFFLADDGFFVTNGSSTTPIGTDPSNSQGIDNWFWSNVNQGALEAIRGGFDATKRCVFFAIPTGTNTLPDTLLSFNPAAGRWTRSAIACETIWTTDNGEDNSPATRQELGLIDQTHTPNTLSGATMSGYLESCDVFFVDGNRRLISGVRPQVNCTDTPYVIIGSRDSLESAVSYSAPVVPDSFTYIAPTLQSGIYNRLRIGSGAASSLRGGTMMIEQEGPI